MSNTRSKNPNRSYLPFSKHAVDHLYTSQLSRSSQRSIDTSTGTEEEDSLINKEESSLVKRPRRLRASPAIRSLVRETRLHPQDLIQPYFLLEGEGKRNSIESLPGIERLSVDHLANEVEAFAMAKGRGVLLFPFIPAHQKDQTGSEALNPKGTLPNAIRKLKREVPDVWVIADIALDPYTSHGHDGVVNDKGEVINDETVVLLGEMALMLAEAGVDMVAPSDMMDGRVGYIRAVLDRAGFFHVGILSYAAKYASCFYGPFRDALGSKPQFGDKKGYQMDPANGREALVECALDEQEGADILMIKPALPYLDVISEVKRRTQLPVAAYQVSGEYAMLCAAAEKGWVDCDRAFEEALLGIKRAGADIIITYRANRLAQKGIG